MKKLAVVIAVAILVAMATLLLQAVGRAQQKAKMVSTVNNGRGIYILLTQDDYALLHRLKPAGPEWTSSTEFLSHVLSEGIRGIQWNFFSAPGLASSTNTELTSEANAWCVNLGATNATTQSDVPFLFTRNVELTNEHGRSIPRMTEHPPYGKLGAVVISWNGRFQRIEEQDLDNAFRGLTADQHRLVLRP
jgi:hypothetical protein